MSRDTSQLALSVIVPCYNVEQFLVRSLACLERQWSGRTDYEIIFVNDASTDGTLNRLNEFKQRYPENVIVVDKKKNEGVAKARNSGLELAHGRWIAFFDPDDALVDNGYCQLLRLVENEDVDVLSFGVSSVIDNEWSEELVRADFNNLKIDWNGSGQEYVLNGLSGVCWRFFFRRNVLKNRRFPQLTLLEDYMFVLPVFLDDVKVARTYTTIYLYMQHSSSATNMLDAQKLNRGCDDMVTVLSEMNAIMDGLGISLNQKLKERQYDYVVNLLSRLLLSNKNMHEIRRIRNLLRDELSVLPLSCNGIKMRMRDLVYSNLWLFALIRIPYRKFRQIKVKN